MMKVQTHTQGIDSFVQRMTRTARDTQRHVGAATIKAVQIVAEAAEARIIIPSQRSGQDDPRIPGAYRYRYQYHPRSPVARRADTVEAVGFVLLDAHWTSARTPGIRRVFARLGLARELQRPALWLQARRPSWVQVDKSQMTEAQLKRWRRSINSKEMKARYLAGQVRQPHKQTDRLLGFTGAPRLLRWARRPDRGEQARRHALRLSNPEARRMLILQPAVDRNLQNILEMYHRAAAAGFSA